MKKKIKQYEKWIIETLQDKVVERKDSELKDTLIIDKENQHYLLFRTGWVTRNNLKDFRDYVVIHFQINQQTGKVWLLSNHTDTPITESLVQKGIPPSEIVLGFHEPIFRSVSGYAVE